MYTHSRQRRRHQARSISSLARQDNGGLVLPPDIFTNVYRKLIIGLAAEHRLLDARMRVTASNTVGVAVVRTTRPLLARSPSFYGGRRYQATNCAPPRAAPVAAAKVQCSSIQAGPAIISASIRFRLKSPTRCATLYQLAPLTLCAGLLVAAVGPEWRE